MRFINFLFVLLIFSCKTASITSNTFLRNEILKYDLNGSDTIVDIGCGDGVQDALISYIYPDTYIILEDINADITENIPIYYKSKAKLTSNIKGKFRIVIGTPLKIPLKSSTYKYVLCRKTFHELTNVDEMESEMNRVLVVGGKLIIVEAEPIKTGELDPYCKRPYLSKQKIIEDLQKANFSLIKAQENFMENNRKFNILIFEKTNSLKSFSNDSQSNYLKIR